MRARRGVGEVKTPLTLNFDQLRRFPGRSVRTVMECSGSDTTFFEHFKGEGPKPSRTHEGMILSASEWTGVPLAAVLNEVGLTAKSRYVRAEGNDLRVPPTAAEGTKSFYYDKGLPIEKALHPDTILAWAQNGQLLEHLHGAPVVTSAANSHYQKHFDRLFALARAGDWDAVRDYKVTGSNSYSKMIVRYRQDLLAVHAASEAPQ